MPKRVARKIISTTGPTLALQELLYGFIMVLLFVTAAQLGISSTTSEDMILLILGMNFTWGVIDMVIFYMVDSFDQKRYVDIISSKDRFDDEHVERVLHETLSGTIVDVLSEEDERCIVRQILESELEPEDQILSERHGMFVSAFYCFLLTMLSTVPAILALLLVKDFSTALTVASAASSVILFFVGYGVAPYLGVNRWIFGVVVMGMALAITVAGVYTGG